MSVQVTTLYSGNELTASVSSSVNCFLLNGNSPGGSEIVRTIDGLTNWNSIRISFRACLVGAPATGNTNAFLWWGLCSGFSGRFWGDTNTEHAVGLMSNSGGGSTRVIGSFTAVTATNTNPPSQNISLGATTWPSAWITGSGFGASGQSNSFPRYETQYSSSWPFYNIVGQSFAPIDCLIVKGSPNWTIGATVYNNNIHIGSGSILGISKTAYRHALQNPSTTNTATDYSAYGTELGYPRPANRSFNNTLTKRWNEDIYGPLDSFNLYFTASAGVYLAVKDIYVTRLT